MATVKRPKYEYKLGESRARNKKNPSIPAIGIYDLPGYTPFPSYAPDIQSARTPNYPTYLPLVQSNATPTLPSFITYLPQIATSTTPTLSNTGQTAPGRTDGTTETTNNVPTFNPYRDPYAFRQVPYWDSDYGGYRYTLNPGNDPRGAQEGQMPLDYAGRNWSSSYAPEYYRNVYRNLPTWIASTASGRTIKGRGRIPGRFTNPEEGELTYGMTEDGRIIRRKIPGGPKDGASSGSSVPAWVGPLVSWRT